MKIRGTILRHAAATAMAGLVLLTPGSGNGGSPAATAELHDFQSNVSPFSMQYLLHSPPGLNGGEEKLPLVIFLHGAGGSGISQPTTGLWEATRTPEYASFILSPQRPGSPRWGPQNPEDLTLEVLDELLESHPIDPNRIYVTGLSAGGFGAARYASALPDRFAAAAPIAGADAVGTGEGVASIPVWSFHGSRDEIVSVQWTREFSQFLMEAGGAVRHTEFPLGVHEVWEQVYDDHTTNELGLYPWMFGRQLPHTQRESVTLVPRRGTWKFLDDGSDQGTAWRAPEFDDSVWNEGVAPLGYGDAEPPFGTDLEETLVHCGPNAPVCDRNNQATTYFRHELLLEEIPNLHSLTMWFERNDSVAIYLNGVEIYRDPELPLDAAFDAYTRLTAPSDFTTSIPIDPALLVEGRNVIAAEVHLGRPFSPELTFGMWITGQLAVVPEPASAAPGCLLAAVCLLRRRVGRHRR